MQARMPLHGLLARARRRGLAKYDAIPYANMHTMSVESVASSVNLALHEIEHDVTNQRNRLRAFPWFTQERVDRLFETNDGADLLLVAHGAPAKLATMMPDLLRLLGE